MLEKIGITTTIPVEVIYAAGCIPVDLNNIFITAENPAALVEEAELAGYPRNICAWIKGIYTTVLANREIRRVIAVTQGDCSNTHALMETLHIQGIEIIPFAFPYDRDYDMLKLQIEKLMQVFGVDWEQVAEQKKRLDKVREKVWLLDEKTWRENSVSGFNNHLYQVMCSDFNGNPELFAQEVKAVLEKLTPLPAGDEIRLGYIGVPPIMTDLYEYLEKKGARVVFNEVQRQFTMPFATSDLVEQYRLYTYPYNIFWRLQDIAAEIEKRNIHGIIHYAQSFCYRHIQDLIIRKELKVPVLTLEGDRPVRLDARTKMRIDAFLDILR
ncbi:2-hydroxyglutaryl-CoA dehydratase D-component [Thermincola potens JR]|uniref:2-hydroxyglutaryl-CoA dehydratase D-component n=1 Tax=Thermincola potens (strain JR) TaxID=635013 RepID=D5XBH8_THEPJ|nr:2-hydroxyglutaryl-CoA dehydratase D-component [Thermincola potens JR]